MLSLISHHMQAINRGYMCVPVHWAVCSQQTLKPNLIRINSDTRTPNRRAALTHDCASDAKFYSTCEPAGAFSVGLGWLCIASPTALYTCVSQVVGKSPLHDSRISYGLAATSCANAALSQHACAHRVCATLVMSRDDVYSVCRVHAFDRIVLLMTPDDIFVRCWLQFHGLRSQIVERESSDASAYRKSG